MTAIPLPPMSRSSEESALIDKEEANLFKITDVKKSLENDFATPRAVRRRISRMSQKFEAINSNFMRVYLRLRPFTPDEINLGEDQSCMKLSDNRNILTLIPPRESNMYKVSSRGVGDTLRHYTFSKIFDDSVDQKEFFNSTALPLVQDFVDGTNSLIFTYGVTNAGKTYTIQGTPDNEGVLPRAVDVLFNSVGDKLLQQVNFCLKMANNLYLSSEEEQKTRDLIKNSLMTMGEEIMNETKSESESSQLHISCSTIDSTRVSDVASLEDTALDPLGEISSPRDSFSGPVKYAIFVSFVEIYKELIYDLLDPIPEDKRQKRPALRLADDKKGTPYVKGAREVQVNSKEEVLKLLAVGRKHLHMAATKLNKDSSRSHCILTITLVQVLDTPDPHSARVSKISFCDLAGSERTNKTREAGDRLKEASKINTSLLKLGMCIEALRSNQASKEKHNQRVVPFRESRLTRLFQSFLLGQGRACMIINANMCASFFDETAHVLKFSAIAKEVQLVRKPKLSVQLQKPELPILAEGKSEIPLKKPRNTIAWERGVSPIKELSEDLAEEEESDESDPGDSESDSDDEDEPNRENDVAFWKKREKTYLQVIEMLKKAVVDLQKKSTEDEMRIRQEVSAGFQNQIVEIQKEHEDRIEETIEMLEDEQHTRMKIMVDMSNRQQEELKEDLEKSHLDMVVKHANMEKELEETTKLLKGKISELQNLQEKVTSFELETNILKLDVKNKEEEISALQRKIQRTSRSSSVFDQNGFVEDLQKENEEGRNIIKCQIEEMEELRERFEEGQEEVESMKEASESLKRENAETVAEIEKLKNTLSRNLDNAELRVSELEGNLAETKKELLETGKELEEYKQKAKELETEHDTLKYELGDSQSKVLEVASAFEDAQKALAEQEKLAEQFRKKCEDVERAKTEIEGRRESYETDISKLKNALAKAEGDLTEEDGLLTEYKTKVEELEDASEDMQKKKQELEKKLDALEKELDVRKNENLSLAQEISSLKSENDELKEKNCDLDRRMSSLENDLNNKDERVEELIAVKAKFESELETLQIENKSLSASLSKAESCKEEEEETIKELREKLLEKETLNVTQLKSEIVENSQSIANLQESNENFEKELVKVRKEMEEKLDEKKEQFEFQQTELAEKNGKLEETETELAQAKQHVCKLEKELEELNESKTEMKEKSETLEHKLDLLSTQKSEIEQKEKSASSDVKILTLERADLLKNIESLKKELGNVEKENRNLEEQNRNLVAEATTVNGNSELESLKSAMVEMDKTQNEQQKMIEKHEKEREKFSAEREELRQKIAEFQKEMQKLEKKKTEIEESRDKAEANRSKIANALGESNEEVKKLEKMCSELRAEIEGGQDSSKKKVLDAQHEIEEMKQTHEKEIQGLKEELKDAKKVEEKLKKAVKSAEDSKDSEMKKFRENRDRIVAALEVQINNQKSTNEMLKCNLDEQISNNVQLKSQNARYLAENSDFKRRQEAAMKRTMRKSMSASAILDPKVVIKQEPGLLLEKKSASESQSSEETLKKTSDENEEVMTPAKGRGGRRTRGSSSSGSLRFSKRGKRTTLRPATPIPEPATEPGDDVENDEEVSPKKTRRMTKRSASKASTTGSSAKLEPSNESEGVLDDSELVRATGNSKTFPTPTMELDVTPQLHKKAPKARKRTVKTRDEKEEQEEFTRSKSTRKTRANANNNNNSEEGEDFATGAAKNILKVGGMIKNSPVGQAFKKIEAAISPASKSPVKGHKKVEETKQARRVRKLHTDDISLPLEATPSPEDVRMVRGQTKHSTSETPARMIRRLRNRK